MNAPPNTASAPVLEITGLTREFGGLRAVAGFDERLESNELVGLIGPNGAGKTTVFNLVSGFYQPTAGNIRINGVDTKGLKPHKVTALGVSRTFQNIRLWNELSVLDNVRTACGVRAKSGLLGALLPTPGWRADERAIPHSHAARERHAGADLHRHAQRTVMVDCAVGVQEGQVAEDRIRCDHAAGGDEYSVAEARARRNHRPRVDRRCEPSAARNDGGGDPGALCRIAHTWHELRAWRHPTGPVCQLAKQRHIGRQWRRAVIEHPSDPPSCRQQGIQYIATLAAAAEDQVDRYAVGRRDGL